MTPPLAILISLILSSQLLSSQITPTESPQMFIASLTSFWPAPPAPKTITFTIPSDDVVQCSDDLQNWQDTGLKINQVFTVSNDRPQQFFRIVRKVKFEMQEIVQRGGPSLPNYLPGNEWMAGYNKCVGYSVALFNAQDRLTRVLTNSPSEITLNQNEVAANYWYRWQDKDGNEL